ncbi:MULTISPECIES: hypothetical protein [Legionella]|uniref:hypothetical protein n=1 Tax=Legionella TaxID=445 RepID=UPI000F8F2485|nr:MULTISPECIES: hypothetical protein [Legionella]MCP0913725.1 hypothetical protein [Legionella sp. 27cVA30]RUQ99325.1 hypothetical protein ELY11_04685 [Legionella septentrionalis]RUR09622.1 hypothetical protein ELY14_08000 [Legionella septentrionalis]RUR14802.1 hypothetical protein ELY10_07585 [Legionella septentrionalis]
MPTLTDAINAIIAGNDEDSIVGKLTSIPKYLFFQPFQKNFSDVALTVTASVTAPLVLGVMTAVAAAMVVTLPLVAIALFAANRFFAARGYEDEYEPGNEDDIRNKAFVGGALALLGAMIALAATPILLLFTVLATPLALASVISRTAATIADAIQSEDELNAYGCQ